MTPFETILVSSKRVACNGGGGPLGHPNVYLSLGVDDRATCPYCSRLFILEHAAQAEGGAHAVAAEPVAPVES
jgi:uncharacterized Zn-finger protein